ncbi:hypothetical protein FRC17_006991 [Serendipita sp. 399]|nr:hypothetical protein FRC17_006991 [Serendipita sp. 399]
MFGAKPATTSFGSALGASTAPAQSTPFSWGTSSTINAATTQPATTTTAAQGFGGLGTSNLFQSTAQQPKPSLLGSTLSGSTLGSLSQPGPSVLGLNPAQPSTAPAPSQLPVLNGAAKFNDLPAPVQDLLNDTDSNTLQADDLLAKNLRAKVDQAVQDVVVCSQIVDGFRESGIQHPNLKTNAQYPIEFFVRLTDQMQERLTRYKSVVDQLNRKLAFSFQAQQTPQDFCRGDEPILRVTVKKGKGLIRAYSAIATTLQSQHAAFIALAAKVAEIEASLEDVKSQFATLYKARTGSALDPFGRTIPAS